MPAIQAGDCLAYGVTQYWQYPFESIVQLRTLSPLYHVEVYVGGNRSISADYRGVGTFPTNLEPARLHSVLRPTESVDLDAGLAWFNAHARGQWYDVWGLIGFGLASDNPQAWICSELATAFYRAAGLRLFAGMEPKAVYPGLFLATSAFSRVWTRGETA